MDINLENFLPILSFAGIIVASWIAGILFQRWVIFSLRAFAKKTAWKWDDIIVGALHRVIVLWFIIAGISTANHLTDIPSSIKVPIDKILVILVIVTITWVILKIFTDLIRIYMDKLQERLPTTSLLINFIKITILVLGGLMVMQSLGISITPILTTLGIGGLAVALALQPTLSNLFSGIQILASRQLKPGDYVRLETGDEGYVTDITWRNTTIRTLANNTIVIPNSKLADNIITNYYLPRKEIAVRVQVGVSYSSDLDKVEDITINVARNVMKDVAGLTTFDPFIRYHTFGDSSINFTVIMRANEVIDQYLIKHEFIKRLHRVYKEKGIEIPFPITTVYINSED
ncbi:MAG: mechanosensitive ion channel family protein [Deltaproteobacteria bacterium]|nr:mechanosensitive ion channel family protein [Deltaproteobacteria bacterium]